MSGFASSIEYIDNGEVASFEQEAAGKIGSYLGIFASILVPFAAPALFGAIAGSGVLGAGLASAAASGTIGALTNTLGSAVVGGLMNAGAAYAGGARGSAVWQAAGMGALTAGGSGFLRAGGLAGLTGAPTAAGANGLAAVPGMPNIGGAVAATPAATSMAVNTAGNLVPGTLGIGGASTAGSIGATAPSSSGIMSGISHLFGSNPQTLNRVSAALVNAAVNGTSMGRLDPLVAQQRAELDALKNSNLAVYNQKVSAAQQILADADRMDPSWYARTRMADVAGMEARQFDQAMRNIAVRQGGSFDDGQRKAYERGQALHTARSKALAYNQGFVNATGVQNQMRTAGAQLLGPNDAGFQTWQADTGLRADQFNAHQQTDESTWGGLSGALFGEHDYTPSTSPDPTADPNRQDSSFANGFFHPFGG